MRNALALTIIAAACLVPHWAAAQSYPVKTVRLILPLAAGTGTDRMTRVLAQKLSDDLGQQVVIENRPGAGAIIGTEAAARSAPDGYTLLMGGSVSLTLAPALYKKVPYDPEKDFTPVARISRFYLILSVHPSLPVKNMKEFIALARARPGELVIASGGTGTTSHLTGALLGSMAKLKLLHVPYKGGGESLVAIMSGEAQLAFTPVSLGIVQGKAGKLRLLGVSSPKRVASLPDIAAIADTVPGFEWSGWQVLMVPTGTPRAIVDRLNAAVAKAAATPDFRSYLQREGSEAFEGGMADFPKFLRAELVKNAELVRIANAKLD